MTSLNDALQENDSVTDTARLLSSTRNLSHSQSNSICLTSSPSSTGSQLTCRICLMPVEPHHIKNYCLCSGSIGVYHKSCQLKWLIISNKEHCEVCNYHFNFKKEYGINYKFICSISFTLGIIGLFIGLVVYTLKEQIILILGLFSSLAIVTCINIFKTSELYKLKKIDLLEIHHNHNHEDEDEDDTELLQCNSEVV